MHCIFLSMPNYREKNMAFIANQTNISPLRYIFQPFCLFPGKIRRRQVPRLSPVYHGSLSIKHSMMPSVDGFYVFERWLSLRFTRNTEKNNKKNAISPCSVTKPPLTIYLAREKWRRVGTDSTRIIRESRDSS